MSGSIGGTCGRPAEADAFADEADAVDAAAFRARSRSFGCTLLITSSKLDEEPGLEPSVAREACPCPALAPAVCCALLPLPDADGVRKNKADDGELDSDSDSATGLLFGRTSGLIGAVCGAEPVLVSGTAAESFSSGADDEAPVSGGVAGELLFALFALPTLVPAALLALPSADRCGMLSGGLDALALAPALSPLPLPLPLLLLLLPSCCQSVLPLAVASA